MSEKNVRHRGAGVIAVERASGGSEAGGAGPGGGGRWSAKRKREAVLRLLRGENLETLCRELGVTAARLSSWRDDFLAGGEAQLKSRALLGRDREVRALQRKLGELTMECELLREKARRLEEGAPDFPWRRSRK